MAVLQWLKAAGTPSSLRHLIEQWRTEWGADIMENSSLRGGFGDFLTTRYPVADLRAPNVIRLAFIDLVTNIAHYLLPEQDVDSFLRRMASEAP